MKKTVDEVLEPIAVMQERSRTGMSVYTRELNGTVHYYFAAFSPHFTTEFNITKDFYDYLSLYNSAGAGNALSDVVKDA